MRKVPYDRDDVNRTRRVTFRLSDDEYDRLDVICTLMGLSHSQYLRKAAFTTKIEAPIFHATLSENASRELAAQMGKIGSNLNQIARKLNSGGPESKRIRTDIARSIDQLNERLRFLKNVEDWRGDSETSERS